MNFMVNHPTMLTLSPEEIKESQTRMEKIYVRVFIALYELMAQCVVCLQQSAWRACTTEDFKVDVIIANPVVHVHVHIAQRLQVPLHLMFTMPWRYIEFSKKILTYVHVVVQPY
jgi:hypothetical protein